MPDAEAPARERRPSEPAFLKPFVDGDFLPALLVILHDIPSCRNALLSPGQLQDDYGYNESWWSGDPIQPPATMYRQDEVESGEPLSPAVPPLLSETQRLMAFLEITDRAYGSADALAQVPGVEMPSKNHSGPLTCLERFMDSWDRINPQNPMFSFSVTNVTEEGDTTPLCHFRIRDGSNSIPLPQTASTFPDLLDKTLWEKSDHEQYDFAHLLEKLPDILVVDMCQHSGQAIEIPTTLNLGRFMLSNKDHLEGIQRENAVHVDKIQDIDATLRSIQTLKTEEPQIPTNKPRDAIAMLKESIQYLKERQHSGESRVEAVKNGHTVCKLECVLASVQARVKGTST